MDANVINTSNIIVKNNGSIALELKPEPRSEGPVKEVPLEIKCPLLSGSFTGNLNDGNLMYTVKIPDPETNERFINDVSRVYDAVFNYE